MPLDQILSLGPQLADYLGEFDHCFSRSEPRGHLASYVKGQLSDLPRKSLQPIADFNGTPRRTLQEFLMCQPWQRVYIKDSEKGPVLWEVKCAPFWLQHDGQVRGPYWLIYARNVLNPKEEEYFLCNASPGTPREVILHVAFALWPVERTLEDEKDELGMSHFEVRKYDAIMRHLAVTQVSHLFLARQTERLRGGKTQRSRCAKFAPPSTR